MTPEQFLRERFYEIRERAEGLHYLENFEDVTKLVHQQLMLLDYHDQFVTIVESPMEFSKAAPAGSDLSINAYQMVVTQQIEFMTRQVYREKFGDEAPTAPLILKMAQSYRSHPDFDPAWEI